MYVKIAVVCALIFGLVLVSTDAKRRKSQGFKPKHNGTKHSVNDIDINAESGQIALSSLANEFVHSLHDPIFLINQASQNAQDNPEFQKALVGIVNDATDLAFAIQKEIHGDPRQLGYQIKSAVIVLTYLLPEITELAEKHENSTFASSLLMEAIDSALLAVQKLEARTDLNQKTNEELVGIVRTTFANLFETLSTTNQNDPDIAEELQIQVHHINHILDKTVNKLEVWLHANPIENENSKTVEAVAQNLAALTADLRKTISTILPVPRLVEIMQSTFKSTAAEIQKLKPTETVANEANEEHAKGIYRENLFDAIATGKTFTIKLDLITKINKVGTPEKVV